MKQLNFYLFMFFLLLTSCGSGQNKTDKSAEAEVESKKAPATESSKQEHNANLTWSELQHIQRESKKPEFVDKFLAAKGWTFKDNKRGEFDCPFDNFTVMPFEYGVFTWAYNPIQGTADSWFQIIYFNEIDNGIGYNIRNKAYCERIKSEIKKSGYKLVLDRKEGNETYRNESYEVIFKTDFSVTDADLMGVAGYNHWWLYLYNYKQAENIKNTRINWREENKNFLTEKRLDPNVKTIIDGKLIPAGMLVEILKTGSGSKPGFNDKVKVHYECKLIDGTVVDSSYELGKPAVFDVNGVIEGFKQGLKLMSAGSTFIIYLPENYAYGAKDVGKIPSYSTLIYKIELQEIIK